MLDQRFPRIAICWFAARELDNTVGSESKNSKNCLLSSARSQMLWTSRGSTHILASERTPVAKPT